MKTLTPRSINDTQITVTSTATLLFTLIDTASTKLGSEGYYAGLGANGIFIRPSNGDIRIATGVSPTTSKGQLLESGFTYFFPGIFLDQLQLIRTSADVTVDIILAVTTINDSPFAVASDSISISAGDIEIGAVELKNGSSDDRAEIDTANRLHVFEEPNIAAPVSTEVTVTNSGTLLLSADANRKGVWIVNGANSITLGPSGITFGTTPSLTAGQPAFLENYGGPLYAITAAANSIVRIFTW